MYLAFELPELERATLAAVEVMRCARLASMHIDYPDSYVFNLKPKLLSCQSDSKSKRELHGCVMAVFYQDKKNP